MKLSNDDMLAYVDGTLSPGRRESVEAHLRLNTEDAELLHEMQEARVLLMELEEAEPVRVSDDFWLKVRAQLPPEGPPRNPVRRFGASLSSWLWPARSAPGLSLRVAAIAVVVALGAFFFSPRHDAPSVMAQPISAADMDFMKTATRQHRAFATSPDSALAPVLPGDARSQESGDEDNEEEGFTP